MELRVIKYFLAVAREENITKAAETLHLTQPTLSRQLRELEEELGAELFIRGKGEPPSQRRAFFSRCGQRSWFPWKREPSMNSPI